MEIETIIRQLHLLEELNHYPIFIVDEKYHITKNSKNDLQLSEFFFADKIKSYLPNSYKVVSIFEQTQVYVFIPCSHLKIGGIVIGPMFYHKPYNKKDIYDNDFLKDNYSLELMEQMAAKMPYITNEIYSFIQLIYEILTGNQLSADNIFESYDSDPILASIMKGIPNESIPSYESEITTYPYHLEKKILYHVAHGEGEQAIVTVNELLTHNNFYFLPIDTQSFPLHTFISYTILLRTAVIEANVDIASAVSLCNLYIEKLNECKTFISLFNIYVCYSRIFNIS
ncbi:MAG: hypothetical protein ACK5LC_05060 [Coprobacillaceae bacterium]